MEAQPLPVIVLAGGKSTRLGRDKASEVLAGRTLLQRAVDACADVASDFVIVRARGQALPAVDAQAEIDVVEDAYPETGPLGGIYTGLSAIAKAAANRGETAAGDSTAGSAATHALVVACDMPMLQPTLLRQLARLAPGHDAVVPIRDGLPEPLCAVYAMGCAEAARSLLERGAYRVGGLLDVIDELMVPEEAWRAFDPDGLSFLNVNREEDLVRARALIDGPGHLSET